jgi:hypothetical protein
MIQVFDGAMCDYVEPSRFTLCLDLWLIVYPNPVSIQVVGRQEESFTAIRQLSNITDI